MGSRDAPSIQAAVPSVDRVLRLTAVQSLIETHGRRVATEAVRAVLDDLRRRLSVEGEAARPLTTQEAIADRVRETIEARSAPSLGAVFNLTGTVLHTNLGRAVLPPEAIAAVAAAAGAPCNLEYDLDAGRRGERDGHVEDLLVRLSGAEAACAVNNNAAAVLVTLNTLALRKEVAVSRGELIEIGGSFRMPDIMARAGCRLREVGATNRTHAKDYTAAVGPRTALFMKVHTSNYTVEGFSAAVPVGELAALARDHGVALVVDLGSGTLIDLARYGLAHEPTVAETLAQGADLVTFSCDKLLGGPQAGVIAGRADLVRRIRRNPMKRAMRCDKMTIAALAQVLRLHGDPDRLAERLPTLRHLSRPAEEIEAQARRLAPALAGCLAEKATIAVAPCQSQIGSGALPVERLPSAALVIRPATGKRGSGAALKRIARALRGLPVPVIGRIHDGACVLDLRCLEDEAAFADQLVHLRPA
ncbi:MAG: L-seryl-tRNA(Sec) selenium transferase [Rhodospirillales bacterium]|nr:L-seryl-tRNA(Sec) selenium transferase [Rhodospirillales bacterium]